jgi:hypothetical protein
VAVFERILLQIFKYTKSDNNEAKASEPRVYRGARMSEKIATYYVPIETEFDMNQTGLGLLKIQ